MDGAVLSAPFNQTDETRAEAAPTTEILSPTTNAGPAKPPLQSTIVAKAPQVPPFHSPVPSIASEQQRIRAPWIVAALAVLVAVGLALALMATYLLRGGDSTNKNGATNNGPQTKSTPKSKFACGVSLAPALFDKWTESGGEDGRLKCPSSSETDAPPSPEGTTGRWVRFAAGDGGYLVLHETGARAGQAFEVSGCMFKLYSSIGGTKSWLGFPITDGRETVTGVQQDFEVGYVVWNRKTAVCEAKKY